MERTTRRAWLSRVDDGMWISSTIDRPDRKEVDMTDVAQVRFVAIR